MLRSAQRGTPTPSGFQSPEFIQQQTYVVCGLSIITQKVAPSPVQELPGCYGVENPETRIQW